MNDRDAAREIFLAGLAEVEAGRLIRPHLRQRLSALPTHRRVYVVGAGKAVGPMAQETELALGDRIIAGHIIVKHGHSVPLRRIQVTEAGHPTPDTAGFRATAEIARLASSAARENAFLLCLLSGGASALLADGPSEADAEDVIELHRQLVRSGADIAEINCVRKHLSRIKGGQLAGLAHPATVASFILSDVLGDSFGVIGSGPTAPDPSTFADALVVIKKYGLDATLPKSLQVHLREGAGGQRRETLKAKDPVFSSVTNHLIRNNSVA